MVTELELKKWDLEHFLSYLYLTIGYADGVLLNEEVEAAKKKLRGFLLQMKPKQVVNADKVVAEVLVEIQKHSSAEIIKTLSKKFEFDTEDKLEIISDLTDIVTVDDVVDLEEHKTLAYIRSVL